MALSCTKIQASILNLIGENKKADLVYRGTRDGLDPKFFHEKCGRMAGSLGIIRTEDGDIFGGYTDIPW